MYMYTCRMVSFENIGRIILSDIVVIKPKNLDVQVLWQNTVYFKNVNDNYMSMVETQNHLSNR